MINLTPKQKQILDFIQDFTRANGYPPSLSEMSKKFNKSIPTIFQFVDTLKTKGYLEKEEDVARGIYTQNPQVFLLGKIAAGKPIEPIENPDPVDVPKEMLTSPGNYYALQVKGNSMIEDGILNGDIILVKYQNTADNGERIIAITEKGATLKVYKNANGKIWLEPRNKTLPNIYPKQLEIRGKFMGLLRKG